MENLPNSYLQYLGLFKYRKAILNIEIPRKTKVVLFWDIQRYPDYGFRYAYPIEIDSSGNGNLGGYFEVSDITVRNWNMSVNFRNNTDNALLVFALF